jgi:hypothetical protein
MEVQAHTFLTSALDGGEWLASCPILFNPGERGPGTHYIEGWVGFNVGLDNVEKREREKSMHLEGWQFRESTAISLEFSNLCFLMARSREAYVYVQVLGARARARSRAARFTDSLFARVKWKLDFAVFFFISWPVGITTGYGMVGRGWIAEGARYFSLLQSFQTASGATQPAIEWVPGALSRG